MDACISSLDRGIEQNSIILRGISQSRVIHILQHRSEVRRCAEELGLQTIVITGELRCLAKDLRQSAAPPLHTFHTVEQIRDHRVAPGRSNGMDITILDCSTIIHASMALDLKPVIEHIDMDLAAQQDVVAMYQRVHKSLSDRPIGIIGFVHTGLSFLYEANLGVVAHEFTAVA